jgi:methyl-accepting chemotaxis protein
MKEWTSLIRPEDKATMERANARVAEFVRFRTELVRLSREAALPEARLWGDNDANRNNRTALNAEIAALAASNDATTHRLAQEVDAFYQNRLWLLIGLVTIGILISVALAIAVVVFAITRPINRLTQAMTTLAGGSTDITVPAIDRGDEIGDMARAVQVFLNQALAVRGLTTQIMENIRRVAMAASQASSAVSQVSDGSNIQLNALKQSSGALEQSTQAISEVARGTQQASERARNAAGLVDKEIKQMTSMVELVGAISRTARRSAGSPMRSRASPARPTCCRSTPRSRRRAPASMAGASPSLPRRSASSPAARAASLRTSPSRSARRPSRRRRAWPWRARSAARCRKSPAASPRPTS